MLNTLSRLIMWEQSLFALPWALAGVVLALIVETKLMDSFSWSRLFWIVLAFLSARTAGMSLNRLIDSKIDYENPRTKDRPLQTGEVTESQVRLMTLGSICLFLFSAWSISWLCFWIAPLIVALLVLYSYTKRFTSSCHLVLGVIQFLGPSMAYLAASGTLSSSVLWLGAALGFSIAGMDVIYAMQDMVHDRRVGLFSIPAKLGLKSALWVAKALHLLAVGALFRVSQIADLSIIFDLGILAVALVYFWNYRKIKEVEAIPKRFFLSNVWVSFIVFTSLLITYLNGRSI